ncbi:NAD(P)H-hydrate dehydratase [Kaistella sp. G5-32]|uniref:Bifunctional NAD(P)H-hydrate repair enzyme n=1 Tax=Kaistella gelatinilytica TaxID=2787636 RepID=A0ABS0F7G7_9FLAO|nr:NAD(P)H-hydrate dehydratase [Kaistella gelatinilytica]MBF8455652.1 NAD(P)H-hydrate dehydratase [Kaistella gelatinilytica]
MKIFSAQQIKNCDTFTIKHEPVYSLNLMQRVADSCVNWISNNFKDKEIFYIFCGNGNNGGGGLALARIMYHKGFDITVFINENENFSKDAMSNLTKIKQIARIDIVDFNETQNFHFKENAVIIDALFGTGLNRKANKKEVDLINFLNGVQLTKVAIDMPSGLSADQMINDNTVIFKADETLSFQFWKKTFLHPETGIYCGKVHLLDISLSEEFIAKEPTTEFVIGEKLIHSIYKIRNEFSNKGTFGKTTIIAGSFGEMGAAVLATKSALKSGSGLTFIIAPKCGYGILQATCPEAKFKDGGENINYHFDIENDSVVGIGPSLGTAPETESAFMDFLKSYEMPLVLDADALNIIAKNSQFLKKIPINSIITPHPKEFERLFGKTENSFLRLDLARKKAAELGIYIVLKDHHTQIITPENHVYYNITGNSGMAKGGSGDALLGIITSLLAQNYSPKDAAIFGVWLHGKAGDLAAEKFSKEAMLPTDLIDELGNVFKSLA